MTLKHFREIRQRGGTNKSNFHDLLKFYSELYLKDKLTNGLDAGLRNEICNWSKLTKTDLKRVNREIDIILDGLFTGKLTYEYVTVGK